MDVTAVDLEPSPGERACADGRDREIAVRWAASALQRGGMLPTSSPNPAANASQSASGSWNADGAARPLRSTS
jgi:hypothetical protein